MSGFPDSLGHDPEATIQDADIEMSEWKRAAREAGPENPQDSLDEKSQDEQAKQDEQAEQAEQEAEQERQDRQDCRDAQDREETADLAEKLQRLQTDARGVRIIADAMHQSHRTSQARIAEVVLKGLLVWAKECVADNRTDLRNQKAARTTYTLLKSPDERHLRHHEWDSHLAFYTC